MTRWNSELVDRLRARFAVGEWPDSDVLAATKGSLTRALIYFQMNVECLWASIICRRAPWMGK